MIRRCAALAVTGGARGGGGKGRRKGWGRVQQSPCHWGKREARKWQLRYGSMYQNCQVMKIFTIAKQIRVKKKNYKWNFLLFFFLEKGEILVCLSDCISTHLVMCRCERCARSTGAGAQVSSRWMVQCCCSHSNHWAKRRGMRRVGAEAGKKMALKRGRALLKGHSFVV